MLTCSAPPRSSHSTVSGGREGSHLYLENEDNGHCHAATAIVMHAKERAEQMLTAAKASQHSDQMDADEDEDQSALEAAQALACD